MVRRSADDAPQALQVAQWLPEGLQSLRHGVTVQMGVPSARISFSRWQNSSQGLQTPPGQSALLSQGWALLLPPSQCKPPP